MAILYLNDINLNYNEIQNVVVQNLATDPSTLYAGLFWFNTTDEQLKYSPDGTTIAVAGKTYTGTSPIDITGTVVSLETSGVTAGSAGDTSNQTPGWGETFKAISCTADAYGRLTALAEHSVTIPSAVATQSAAGLESAADKSKLDNITSSDSSVKLYLIGATSQTDAPVTYSQDTAYVGTDGHLYSDSKQVVNTSGEQALTNKTYNGYTLGAACAKGVDTSVSDSSTDDSVPTSKAVYDYVGSAIAASDALIYKGTLGTGGTITELPTTYNVGWTYRVITAGTYAGVVCEVGDLVAAIVARSGSGCLDSDWTVAQTNIDGAITDIETASGTPLTATESGTTVTLTHNASGVTAASKGDTTAQTPSFGDTFKALSGTVNATGHLTAFEEHTVAIPDAVATQSAAGLMSAADKTNLDNLVAASTLSTYTETNSALTASSGVCTWTVTHSLANQYPIVQIYRVSDGAQVMAEVVGTSASAATIKILSTSSIAAGTYRVVIMG